MRKRYAAIAAMAAASLALAACSSSSKSNNTGGNSSPGSGSSSSVSGGGGSSDGSVIKVGLMNDSTGPASSAYLTTTKGVDAALNPINAAGGVNGHKIQYVTADTTSTPAGALTAAQKLVQQDHVMAIIENSSVFYGAEPWLLQHNVPVIGSAIDGPIWAETKNTNLFPAGGFTAPGYANTYFGTFAKSIGGTKCGSLGYAESVSSQLSASGFLKSCQKAGLQAGYLNNQFPTGSTDVGAIALAIKNSGTDVVYLPIDPSTAFALVGAFAQLGYKAKLIAATGYGGDLLASKAAVQAGQGVYFGTISVPLEANTPATQKMKADLAAVGVNTDPSFSEQEGYLLIKLLQTGLQGAGSNPTAASLESALAGIKGYDAGGLIGTPYDMRNFTPTQGCSYITQLSGSEFKVLPKICGDYFKSS